MRRALGSYVQVTGPFPKRLNGNMVPPLALGQPLPASGLCRGPCSDALLLFSPSPLLLAYRRVLSA